MAGFHGGGGGMAAEDYEEEEVWAMLKAKDQGSNSISKITRNLSTSSSTSRAIPRSASSSGGASSAPLTIPDWSKILKKKPKKNMWDDGDDGDGDGDDEMLPPHEYLARRLASTQIASFSMCEGVGRTLKGRDLSNLRNAILTKTGFLE
ncbi:protein S40-7-like [Salvia miltiorrhiza]|uniref:protein S40-7-like n=1 Tax=Salvia miltiorrhiza TaxID=226208 RepID=UPI0025AC187D|nr:protein S40-7-like [Salvia miltiorrhiza]